MFGEEKEYDEYKQRPEEFEERRQAQAANQDEEQPPSDEDEPDKIDPVDYDAMDRRLRKSGNGNQLCLFL